MASGERDRNPSRKMNYDKALSRCKTPLARDVLSNELERLINQNRHFQRRTEVTEKKEERIAESYCRAFLPNGVRCNTRIDAKERFCKACQQRIAEQQKKSPPEAI